jgi:hypothetical protein
VAAFWTDKVGVNAVVSVVWMDNQGPFAYADNASLCGGLYVALTATTETRCLWLATEIRV